MMGQKDNTKYYEELGAKLLKIREEKKLLQKDIASEVGVTFQQWQKYEKGANRIPTKALVIFCEITNTDIRELTGCTAGDYENIYKEAVVNYNNTTTVNHVYHYNGFFSNFLNMDLGLMKNKIVVIAVIINLIVWATFSVLKSFPSLNAQYNIVFLSIQLLVLATSFAISLFVVFGYSALTYGASYIAYECLYGLAVRFLRAYFAMDLPVLGWGRLALHGTPILLTFLTFYILKKCSVNLNVVPKAEEKEA